MKDSAHPAEIDGIDPSKIYPLKTFMRLAGMGLAAMRSARRAGLPVSYVGNLAFVRGSDFAEFVKANAKNLHRRGGHREAGG